MDPLDSIVKACESLVKAQTELAARLPGSQAEEVRARLDATRALLRQASERLANIKPGEPPLPLDPEMAAMVQKARAESAARQERMAARQALLPKLPPPPKIELLNGHALGKLVLLELRLVTQRSEESESSKSADDFHWESTGAWDALGI